MDNYKIYKHTFPNGKVYIGLTSQNVNKRWQNGFGYERQQYLYNAIKKYGWQNTIHEILFDNLTKENAEQKEIELIAQYKSNQREFGYNIENGGNINKVSEETKEKIRKANIGKSMSEYTKQRLLQANIGKHLSEETKHKISIANTGRIVSKKTRQILSMSRKGKKLSNETKEKLRQRNLGKKLSADTIEKMRGRKLSLETRLKMSKSRQGKPRSEEIKEKLRKINLGKKMSINTRNKMSLSQIGKKQTKETIQKRISKIYNICGKKIICIETGTIYNSISQASRILNIDRHTIIRSCKNKCKSKKKIHFKYY